MNPQQGRRLSPGIFSPEGAAWAAALMLGLWLYWHSGPAPFLQWPPDWPGLLGRCLVAVAGVRLAWLDMRHRKR